MLTPGQSQRGRRAASEVGKLELGGCGCGILIFNCEIVALINRLRTTEIRSGEYCRNGNSAYQVRLAEYSGRYFWNRS